MRNFLFLFLLVFTAFKCDDDQVIGPSTTVNLNFKAVYQDEPLVMLQQYNYPDNHLIRFNHFNFFISNVVLLDETGGGETQLVDVNFMDFSGNSTVAEANTPITFSKTKVPAGNYKGIRIGIGVPAEWNKASSGQFGAGHPLRQTFNSHFWSDWGSYIFMKSEGIYDLDNNGQFDGSDRGFEHHPGTNDVYETVTILTPVTLEENKPFDLNLLVDILKIYQKDNDFLDLSDINNKDTQEASDLPLAKWLTNNFQQAIKVE